MTHTAHINPMTSDSDEADRVRRSTSRASNARIDGITNANIACHAGKSSNDIRQRIDQLDREWDIERVLEVNASTLALTGLLLGLSVDRKWLVLPVTVMAFLLQHGVQGWCPPLPILRRLGVRTRGEIDREKFALQERLKSLETTADTDAAVNSVVGTA